MASVCWNHRFGCFGSKASSLTGMWGPDVWIEEDVTVVVVSMGVPRFAVENWVVRLCTREEDGNGGSAVAAATWSRSASERSRLPNIAAGVLSGSPIWQVNTTTAKCVLTLLT